VAHGDDDTDSLMARDERELGDELALVDVLGVVILVPLLEPP